MSPLEGLWEAETAGGGDCWAFFAYFFVFFPLSAGRHNGTHVRPHNGPSTWPGTSAGLPRAGARDVPARPRPRQPSQEWSWGPASCRWYPPFRRFSDVFPTISRRARSAGPLRPRFRSYCGGRLYVRVLDVALGLHPHAPGIGRGLRDTHAHVPMTGYVG